MLMRFVFKLDARQMVRWLSPEATQMVRWLSLEATQMVRWLSLEATQMVRWLSQLQTMHWRLSLTATQMVLCLRLFLSNVADQYKMVKLL